MARFGGGQNIMTRAGGRRGAGQITRPFDVLLPRRAAARYAMTQGRLNQVGSSAVAKPRAKARRAGRGPD